MEISKTYCIIADASHDVRFFLFAVSEDKSGVAKPEARLKLAKDVLGEHGSLAPCTPHKDGWVHRIEHLVTLAGRINIQMASNGCLD